MLVERVEAKWVDAFAQVFGLCRVKEGEAIAILSETQSRAINVRLAELALLRLKTRHYHIVVPTPPQRAPVPVRSTGASDTVQGLAPVV
ncbi:MAG: peptidase M29, partial [Proteobacteria bacterium]|nr:peptidase M29 [Pseudomonadota bacterium]